jgi:hypothetical protein
MHGKPIWTQPIKPARKRTIPGAETEAVAAVAEAEKLTPPGAPLASALGELAAIYLEHRKFAPAE